MITLGHVNIRTERLEETVAFYEALLDFRRGPAATNPTPHNVWLHDGAGAPILHVNALRDGESQRPGDGGCLDHIAFNCPDREAMADRLADRGIAYRVVETRVPGLVQFNLRDPNGIPVELTFGHEAVTRAP